MNKPIPDDLDKKCKELNDLFTKNAKDIAKAINDNHEEWLTELATNPCLYFLAHLFVTALSNDLEKVEKVRLELSDWL